MSQVTVEQLKTMKPEQIAALINAMDAARQTKLSFKVGEKGGVSVFGLNARFPVTLYANQWERLISVVPQLEAFIAENNAKLSRK